MFLAWIAFCISCAWLIVHGFKHLSRRQKLLLPLSRIRRQRVEITVKNVHLRVQTDVFNTHHDALCAWFANRKYMHTKQILRYFYHIGSIMGVLGMLGVIALLFRTTATLGSSVFYNIVDTGHPNNLAKRSFSEGEAGSATNVYSNDGFAIKPIIPGVTVPISHLPLIIFALCISQILHEHGHAITAALYHIPIISSGISIILVIPSAFVSLSSSYLEELSPLGRLQIVSAGCFHNLLLWSALVATARTGIGPHAWSLLGYIDISNKGRVVVSIDSDSPLQGHFTLGSLVTHLDDVPINSSVDEDIWSSFLLGSSNLPIASDVGFCVNMQTLKDQSHQCCARDYKETSQSSFSCFLLLPSPQETFCLDPIPILTENRHRCSTVAECGAVETCVKLHDTEQLLRISLQRNPVLPSSINDEVILWAGPKAEVWEQVKVGTLIPRFSFLPLGLPNTIKEFMNYLLLTNLSLYLLNLLPLPGLDGSQLLTVVLELIFTGRSNLMDAGTYDIEDLSIHRRRFRESTAQRLLRKIISTSTIALLSLCILLGLTKWIMG
ncbi:hypothetical protein BJ138DRAFT_1084989 [Hygrophoropsis aurantiaca]|uniref:Uncharacterized protein n=1 Tax=Hygrophoropsis aurantiaca TaxID=72124 RepID=A0ACB8AF01_9AGAM|nr:hypothetical protein BJ138DRAFT_1084989 [Hygrophoropsis aurantiaca]